MTTPEKAFNVRGKGRHYEHPDGRDAHVCACGCGLPTEIATRTRPNRGQVKGEPLKYRLGHNSYVRPPLIDRFMDRVSRAEDGCWNWTGGKTSGEFDYPRFCIRKTEYVLAHRWSYEYHVGPIPDGLTIDHLCRNTMCVNPSHLEPVTAVENVMRGQGAGALNVHKTHCKRGHEFTPDNIYHRTSKNGRPGRQCKRCTLEGAR